MKKKNYLMIATLLIVCGLLSTVFTSCSQHKNLGLQLYSIRDSISADVPGAIEKVANMGYKFVEPANYNNGKFYGMEPAAFKALCEKNGLYVLSSHTSHGLPDSSNYEETMAWWDKCIDAHAAVGAKFLVQPSMGASAYESVENLQKWCDYFNEVGAKCNAKGIKFGYHNHAKEFTTVFDGVKLYDYMLNHTDPSKVFFEIDLYWAVVGGINPVDYFNKYPGRFLLWHIKDKEEIGASGMMDFESIWAEREKSGMQYGIVEVERYNFDQYTSCDKSLQYLNKADYVVMPE